VSITLAQLEQETARRLGPFLLTAADPQVPNPSAPNWVIVPYLRSALDQDQVTNLWLLRRGVHADGTPVAGYDARDRARQVLSYDAQQGRVVPDRDWYLAPDPQEQLEFHHLDPEHELRVATLAGLRRCFFEDRFQLGAGVVCEADLTAALPWLDETCQVVRVQAGPPNCGPLGDVPYSTFMECGHVWLRVGSAGCASAGGSGLLVTVRRAHSTWVNGADSTSGPMADTDTLEVDLDYAASAAHIEAWHHFPARLYEAAAGNLQATQAMAATEFTRQARAHAPRRAGRVAFSTLVSV
jgi:hypothetical protein